MTKEIPQDNKPDKPFVIRFRVGELKGRTGHGTSRSKGPPETMGSGCGGGSEVNDCSGDSCNNSCN